MSSVLDAAHTSNGDATFGQVTDLLDNQVAVVKTAAINHGVGYNSIRDVVTNGMAVPAAVRPVNTTDAVVPIRVKPADMPLGG